MTALRRIVVEQRVPIATHTFKYIRSELERMEVATSPPPPAAVARSDSYHSHDLRRYEEHDFEEKMIARYMKKKRTHWRTEMKSMMKVEKITDVFILLPPATATLQRQHFMLNVYRENL